MFFTELFFKKKCEHNKITPNMEQGYCPDCGKLIKNEWYIARCACCGVKIKAMCKNGVVMPQNHYCANCGAEEFITEKVEQINFIDINFAVLIKKEAEKEFQPKFTCYSWQEKTPEQPKLLVQY